MYIKLFKWKIRSAYIVIIFLSLISLQTVSIYSIFPNVPLRMEIQENIRRGEMEAPYQYRILNPSVAFLIQQIISPVITDRSAAHVLSFQIISFFIFLIIYILFYFFLRKFFSETTCLLGLMMLYIVIPLGITGIWGEEGDYLTLLFYLIGLTLIFNSREKYLPLVFAFGVFNREQIIFLIIFYVCYAYSMKKLFKSETLIIIFLSVVLCLGSYFALRFIYGFKESKYTIQWNTSENIREYYKIISLWTVMVLPFVILGLLSFKKSSAFFKFSFISIGIYIVGFFFNGFMTQMTKFLPAYLILIPMSLQYLTKEFTGEKFSDNLIPAENVN